MIGRKRTRQAVTVLLLSGILLSYPSVRGEAAVITSNATDKIAVVFNENTAYSAGDYVTYHGEMYICTADAQGTWEAVQPDFMQITKNSELGRAEDLSASYDDHADPSGETSLMAFAANAWQKLKLFLGIGTASADTDAGNYKNASVSAKLNYLEQQNESLGRNLEDLQGNVIRSFQSVSNGKTLLAGAITDKGGTAGPLDTFQQFSQAIRDLAQAQYDDGYKNGHGDGYNSGHDDGYNSGREDGYNSGRDDGYAGGYNDGIIFADSRVNEDSESYKKALAEDHTKEWKFETRLTYDGPEDGAEYFGSEPGITGNHRNWNFHKSFEGHKIVGVFLSEFYYSPFGSSYRDELTFKIGGEYRHLSTAKGERMYHTENDVYWGPCPFNVIDKENDYVTLEITVVYI